MWHELKFNLSTQTPAWVSGRQVLRFLLEQDEFLFIHHKAWRKEIYTVASEDTRETVALFPVLDEHTWHVLVCLVREKILVVSFCFLTLIWSIKHWLILARKKND
jgi:hypothetical protein